MNQEKKAAEKLGQLTQEQNQAYQATQQAANGAAATQTRSGALDDEKRVKVLSPGMMVFKRFVRNRLAITGLFILVAMFLFAFLGPLFMPYTQSQVFHTQASMLKDFAGAIKNRELRYTAVEGKSFPTAAAGRFLLAKNAGQNSFESAGKQYTLVNEGDAFFRIKEMTVISDVAARKKLYAYENVLPGVTLSPEFKKAFEAAHQAGAEEFTFDGAQYMILRNKLDVKIAQAQDLALASFRIYDPYQAQDAKTVESYAFRLAAESAIAQGKTAFEADGARYSITAQGSDLTILRGDVAGKAPFAAVSDIIVNSLNREEFLSVEFKNAVREAIRVNVKKFDFAGSDNQATEYRINLVNSNYGIQRETTTALIDMFHQPDSEHLLGTDQNGMDVLTRLMYGGRISLLVGFVVVFLEMLIGVTFGGISGYFGGWVDTLMMRFVDLFNCIPSLPILIMLGAFMDTMEVNPYVRVMMLMVVLGLLGWTGIARVVRGQILALREQDFMVATEATGIKVSRRIFRHLIPNVMPLLIVQATMSLGGIILTEATLSFLGLGVKYPVASWGSIIHAASMPHIVTNYWFVWIPAGMLILLTVLGFNFVGDGLRDAFDPKMKR